MKNLFQKLLLEAGIEINGKEPWDIQVYNDKLFKRIISQGSLGLGEAYMEGWWDAKNLDEFFAKVVGANLARKVPINFRLIWFFLKAQLINSSKFNPYKIGSHHYDIGNDLYERMLDKRLTYTCGYWKEAKTLDGAQEAKLDLVCRKIGLKKGQKVLDIGSGWGSFIGYAAEKYGAECVGVTVSKSQADYANKRYAGLSAKTLLTDYREIDGQFDHIVSLGMFEHVGVKNYRAFMKKVRSLLKDDGLFLLHTIGSSTSVIAGNPWMSKYIFPNSMLPSIKQIGKSAERLFVMEDWHNFGADYEPTLLDWFKNFDAGWPDIKNKYGDKFYLMWKYYLLATAGAFRARNIQLWQIVLSKNGVSGGYKSVR